MTVCYHVFSTPMGFCTVAWTEVGLISVQWGGDRAQSEKKLRKYLSNRYQDAEVAEATKPSGKIVKLVKQLKQHLAGDPTDITEVDVDFSRLPQFHVKIYREARKISLGQTMTYGALAKKVGSPQAARAVGQAMARNPMPLVVPCHRVVGSGQKLTGFSAPGGVKTKKILLQKEAEKIS